MINYARLPHLRFGRTRFIIHTNSKPSFRLLLFDWFFGTITRGQAAELFRNLQTIQEEEAAHRPGPSPDRHHPAPLVRKKQRGCALSNMSRCRGGGRPPGGQGLRRSRRPLYIYLATSGVSISETGGKEALRRGRTPPPLYRI